MKNSKSSKNINGEKFVVVINSSDDCKLSFTLKAISKTFRIHFNESHSNMSNIESVIKCNSFSDVYDYLATEISERNIDKLIAFIDITVKRFAHKYKGNQNADI